MKKTLLLSVVASTMIMAGGDIEPEAVPVSEDLNIFSSLKVKGELRPRYEYVEVDPSTKSSANAFTNRFALGVGMDLLETGSLSAYVEMTNVIGNSRYDSFSNGELGYEVVADPSQTRVTQAYLDAKAGETLFRLGRQTVNLDNQRFVGSVDWRQMPQTFDAIAIVDTTSIENFSFVGAYVDRVNTIFDDGVTKVNSFDTSTAILNAGYTFNAHAHLTGYAYLVGSIHDTYGLALTGAPTVGDVKLNYRAEYAIQGDASLEVDSVQADADASYYSLALGANYNGFLAGVNYEVLSGTNGLDGNTAFSTPLATLHKFNGFADIFLATPTEGLRDANIMIGYKADGFGVAKIIYHDFDSDEGSTDLGSEIDFLYKTKVPGLVDVSLLLKGSLFSKGDITAPGLASKDVSKFWAMLDYKF
ncbi:MAG: hypothetical protein GQ531_06215 [Sulfurovum sp.]|nr:hypothetical protein [Sulfurovum sp.]